MSDVVGRINFGPILPSQSAMDAGQTQVVHLGQVRAQREQPDAEHVRKDQYGRPMYRFALSYEMDGTEWATHVWAYSFEDAEARVAAMSRTLTVLGQVHCDIAG